MLNPAGVAMLAALLAAPAASPLRPPSLGERASILRWADEGSMLGAGRFGPLRLGMTYGGGQWATRTRLRRDDLFRPPCQTFGARRLGTSFFGLTARGTVRRLVIGGRRLATAEGLRVGDDEGRVIAIYGRPDRRAPDPFIPDGEKLSYRTTARPGAPRRRIVTIDGADRVVEITVGFTPEVNFDEGCA